MTLLGIDTSTALCAVAVVSDGRVLASKTAGVPQAHAEKLLSIIDACLLAAGTPDRRPDAVAVASGPGSFTGLRIGFSTAKGICFARGAALVAVPTFDAWAFNAVKDDRVPAGSSILTVMSAGREDAYAALFRRAGTGFVTEREPAVYALRDLPALAGRPGDAAIIADDRARAADWFPGISPDRIAAAAGLSDNPAIDVALLGEMMCRGGVTADLRYAEPAYVKDFSYKLKNGKGA